MSLPLLTATAMHWGGPGPGFAWWFLIPIFWFLLLGLLFTLLFRRARRFGPPPWASRDGRFPGPGGAGGDVRGAEQILAERFARGEVEEIEYRARLEVLRAGRETPAS